MKIKLCGALVALAVSVIYGGQVLAYGGILPTSPGDGGPVLTPEIDASAGMAALALVASLGALLYSKARK